MYRQKFNSGSEATKFIEEHFCDFYKNRGYKKEPSVKITSKVDPTVRFIGSHISVLKSSLFQGVPYPGKYIVQNCVRTWNAQDLHKEDFNPTWGSYFTSIGVLSSPDLNRSFLDMKDFLNKSLGFLDNEIKLRVSSKDMDLIEVCKRYYPHTSLEIDSMDEGYYKHKIGEKTISGRSFNIALPNSQTGIFSDIGNLIVLEDNYSMKGIELAIGTSTIAKEVCNLNHVLDCYELPVLIQNPSTRIKFLDSLLTSTVLLSEGLKPVSSSNQGRILKKYLKSFRQYAHQENISLKDIRGLVGKIVKDQRLEQNPYPELETYFQR